MAERNATEPMVFRPMAPADADAAVGLVRRVFDAFVAPQYGPQGIATFREFVCADAMAARLAAGHFAIVAESGAAIVGVIEVRDNRHIALLFVAAPHQRRGIARRLFRQAATICRQRDPQLDGITVNASPNALTAYRRLGFEATEDEKTVNGIRFVPMAFAFAPTGAVPALRAVAES